MGYCIEILQDFLIYIVTHTKEYGPTSCQLGIVERMMYAMLYFVCYAVIGTFPHISVWCDIEFVLGMHVLRVIQVTEA